MLRTVWRVIQAHMLLSLVGLCVLPAFADSSRLEALDIDQANVIQLQVQGEGFDPQLSSRKNPNGLYQVICESSPVTLSPQAQQSLDGFRAAVKKQYPELTQVEVQQTGQTVRFIFTGRQKLHPQILSNTGNHISITLLSTSKAGAASVDTVQIVEQEGKPLENVELTLDEQLVQRQKQLDARKQLIKAQEQAWQKQTDSPQKTVVQSVAVPDVKQTVHFKPSQNFSVQQQSLPTSPVEPSNETTDKSSDDNVVSPLHLTAPPASLLQTVYQANRTNIPGDSLYAFLKDPQVDLPIQEAIRQALQGQREQAIISLQDYLKSHPSDATAQAALAATLLNGNPSNAKYNDDRTQATTLLKQVVNQTPYLPAYEQLIRLATDDNRLTDAESFLEKAELLSTGKPSLLFLRGRLSEAQNNLDTAQDSYQKCLEEAPYFTEAHYRLAQVALKSGKLETAQWELEQLLQSVPDDGRALKLLAFLDQRQEKNGQALALYMKALQPDVLLNTARLLAKQGDTAKAAAILHSVESLAEGNPDLLFNIGMTYADLHNTGKAKTILTRFIQSQGVSQDTRVSQAKETLKKLGH